MQVPTCFAKCSSHMHRIQVGNGQYIGFLFVIPVIIDIHEHSFEVYTLVSDIHENVDLVLGIKNIFESEGVIDSCNSCFSFLNRSIPFFPKEKTEIPTQDTKDGDSRSSIYRGIVRDGNYKCFRYDSTCYKHDEIEIHKKQGYLENHQQCQ